MAVNDFFRDRTTKPNSVLNPFLEPQKLDCRHVIHLRLHSALDVLARTTAPPDTGMRERRPERRGAVLVVATLLGRQLSCWHRIPAVEVR